MYQYWAFGLHINSEIEFPELYPAAFDKPDLEISLGKTPASLEGSTVVNKVRFSASPGEYLQKVNDIGSYYASGGKKIVVDPAPGADLESVRLFMLSGPIAAILHQQNKIPLHCSGIITSAGLVLFTGKSGAGKSTIAYGLQQEGYRLFSDDICVLHSVDASETVLAAPSYPILKLWETTIEKVNAGNARNKYKLRPHLPKYGFLQHENFTMQSLPVHSVFVLRSDNTVTGFGCKQLDKISAFNALQQNTFRRGQVDMMQLRSAHFKMISRLTNQAEVKELSRPLDGDIGAFIQFIKEHL